MLFRRKLALMICPELANLPHHSMNRSAPRKRERSEWDGHNLSKLDLLYAASTGVVLDLRTAPEYSGPMYCWKRTREQVRKNAVNALIRLRSGRQSGVHQVTAFLALNYLSAIWPTDLAWPSDIPRPTPNKKEAA